MKNKMNLNEATVNLNPASPMEIVFGWFKLFWVLYGLTLLAGMIAMRRSGGDWGFAIFSVAIMLEIAWFPGLIMSLVVSKISECSNYTKTKSVFAGGVKQALQRCLRTRLGSFSGLSVRAALCLVVMLMACNIASLFIPDVWLAGLAGGAVLSLGGFLIIGFYLIRGRVRSAYLRRQLL